MHEVWCFGSDGITREFHPTAQVNFGAVVVGQFSSDNLTENGRRIPFISQISINGSVEYLGIHNFHRTNGPMWVDNLLDTRSILGDCGTPNYNWPLSQLRFFSVLWRGAVHARPAYLPAWSLENVRAAARRVCGDWICGRRCSRMRSPDTSRNPTRNLRINRRGDAW